LQNVFKLRQGGFTNCTDANCTDAHPGAALVSVQPCGLRHGPSPQRSVPSPHWQAPQP
jgi:hypothetical protein